MAENFCHNGQFYWHSVLLVFESCLTLKEEDERKELCIYRNVDIVDFENSSGC